MIHFFPFIGLGVKDEFVNQFDLAVNKSIKHITDQKIGEHTIQYESNDAVSSISAYP
jgi:hypothetical protein